MAVPCERQELAEPLKDAAALALSTLKIACHDAGDTKAHEDAWKSLFVEKYVPKKPDAQEASKGRAFTRYKKDLADKGIVLDVGCGFFAPLWPPDKTGQNDEGG